MIWYAKLPELKTIICNIIKSSLSWISISFCLNPSLTASLFSITTERRKGEKSPWLLCWLIVCVREVKECASEWLPPPGQFWVANSTLLSGCARSCLRTRGKDLGLLGCFWQLGPGIGSGNSNFYFQRNPDQGPVLNDEVILFLYCYFQSFWQPGYFLLADNIDGLYNSQEPKPLLLLYSLSCCFGLGINFLKEWTSQDRLGFAAVTTPNLGGSEPHCFTSAYTMCSSEVGRGFASYAGCHALLGPLADGAAAVLPVGTSAGETW